MEAHFEDKDKERKDASLERENSSGSSSSGGYGYSSTEGFPVLDVLEVMKESMRLMRKRSPLFMSLASVLLVPLSFIVLSHILVTHSLMNRLAVQIEAICQRTSFSVPPRDEFLFHTLAELILSAIVYFPLAICLDLPAKVAISYTVVSAYAGRKLSLSRAVSVVPRLWKRLIATYLWCCLVGVGALVALITLLGVAAVIINFLGLDNAVLLVSDLLLATVFCVVLALIVVVSNLAVTATILEDIVGYAALSRAIQLIQGRTRVAVGLLLVTATGLLGIELLYQSHILGNSDQPFQDLSSILWEGPLLVFMYSVIHTFDCIMATVFYFTCKAFRFEGFDRYAAIEHLEGVNHHGASNGNGHLKNLPL